MIILVGINHTCDDIITQEKIALSGKQLLTAYQKINDSNLVSEVMWLSTCGRTECIAYAENPKHLKNWYVKYFKIENQAAVYCLTEEKALEHILITACGLNSRIIGETQVLGQLKRAICQAQELQAIGPALSFWLPTLRTVAKNIRNKLGISTCAMSIPSMIKQILAVKTKQKMLIVGTGEIGQQAICFFAQHNLFDITIIGRDKEKTAKIAKNTGTKWLLIKDLSLALVNTDILITATNSNNILLAHDTMQTIQKHREYKNLYIFDLAMPRNIDPKCQTIQNISIYSLNKLSDLVSAQHNIQANLIEQAHKEIKSSISSQLKEQQPKSHNDVLVNFRKSITSINDEILTWGQQELSKGIDPEVVLSQSLRKLSRKILHGPTTTLKQAVSTNQKDYLYYMQMFLNTIESQKKPIEKNDKVHQNEN